MKHVKFTAIAAITAVVCLTLPALASAATVTTETEAAAFAGYDHGIPVYVMPTVTVTAGNAPVAARQQAGRASAAGRVAQAGAKASSGTPIQKNERLASR